MDPARSRSESADGDLPASADTTGMVALDQAARGTITEGVALLDTDWFAMDLTGGSAYQIQILGALGADCTLLAPIIESVRDASGRTVPGTEWWIEDRGPWYRLTFTPESDGRYYIAVVGEANYAGVGTYIVALTGGAAGHADRIAAIGSQGCFPEPPTGLGLSDVTGGSVTLSWTAPAHSGISGYKILRGTDASSLSVIVKDTGGTATRYVDAGVSPSTAYFYAVVALSAAGEAAPSLTASATTPDTGNVERSTAVPGSPGLTLTPSFDQVTLDWTAPTGDAVTGYRIWRGPDADSLSVLVSDTASTATSYVDDTVEAETTYNYAVAALNANGEGEQSTSSIATLSAPRIINVPRSEPQIAAQQSFSDNPVVTFASNLGQTSAGSSNEEFNFEVLGSFEVHLQQSFTTGPDGAGFLLHSFGFEARQRNDSLFVSLWTDEEGAPGRKLADLGRLDSGTSYTDYALDYLDVFLFPSTTYWVRFEVSPCAYTQYLGDNHAANDLLPSNEFHGDGCGEPCPAGPSTAGTGERLKFRLKGRVVPIASSDGPPPIEALVSSLIGSNPRNLDDELDLRQRLPRTTVHDGILPAGLRHRIRELSGT